MSNILKKLGWTSNVGFILSYNYELLCFYNKEERGQAICKPRFSTAKDMYKMHDWGQ